MSGWLGGADGEPAEAIVHAEVDAGFKAELRRLEVQSLVLIGDVESHVGQAFNHCLSGIRLACECCHVSQASAAEAATNEPSRKRVFQDMASPRPKQPQSMPTPRLKVKAMIPKKVPRIRVAVMAAGTMR